MSEVVELRTLEILDRFISATDRNKKIPTKYKVADKCVFNSAAGTSTRACINEKTMQQENKQCRLSVIKLPIK